MSQPQRSSARICASVASRSAVSVFVIDCTVTRLPPPMATPRTVTVLLCLLIDVSPPPNQNSPMMSLNAITAISTSRNSINTALTAFSYFGSIGLRRMPSMI